MPGPMTISAAVDYISRLTPTYRSPILKGDGVYVLTPPAELPPEFRDAQTERTEHYRFSADRTTARTKPDHAPAYIVTSYGLPIAWVTLDGRTHYTENLGNHADGARLRAIRRHQDAVRAVWPDRFGRDRDGDVSARVPGGHVMLEDGEIVPDEEEMPPVFTKYPGTIYLDPATGEITGDAPDKLGKGDRVCDTAGRAGTVYTGEAGGFVRVTFDGEREDSLVDTSKLRRI